MTTWFQGQSEESKKGTIGEILVHKVCTDELALQEGKDFFFHAPPFPDLTHEPDFTFMKGHKISSTLSVTHRTASSQSQYDFWENIEELFEDKIILGNNCICGMITLGLKEGWKNWLLDGFRVLYDKYAIPEEKLGHKISVLNFLASRLKKVGAKDFEAKVNVIRQNQNRKEIRNLINEISNFIDELRKTTKPKKEFFPLWDKERVLFKKVLSKKEFIVREYNQFPDMKYAILGIAQLDKAETQRLKKIVNGPMKGRDAFFERCRELKIIDSSGKIVNPLLKDYVEGKCDQEMIRFILDMIKKEIPTFEKTLKELKNVQYLLERVDIILKNTKNLSSTREIAQVLYETCSNNFSFKGIKDKRNWVLITLMEMSGLKINKLRNEVNKIFKAKGISKVLPYSIYYEKFSKEECQVIAEVIQRHLPKKLSGIRERIVKNLVERRIYSLKNDRRLTPLRYAFAYQLMKSNIPQTIVHGYPKKKYEYIDTFFSDLLNLRRGLAGKVGRTFVITQKNKQFTIHVQSTDPSGLQHRSPEQAGRCRGIRYRFKKGEWIDISDETSDHYSLVPIMILDGAWNGKEVFRLFTAGVKYIFKPSLKSKWPIISFLENELNLS